MAAPLRSLIRSAPAARFGEPSILRALAVRPISSRAGPSRLPAHSLHPRAFSSTVRWSNAPPTQPPNPSNASQPLESEVDSGAAAIEAPPEGYKPQKIGQIEPRLSMTFTCTADDCGHRSTHEFTKRSYQKGIVIVQCPECKNRHLIADHLGWFKESTEEGKLRTVEDLLRAKGEKIRKGRVNMDGDIEYDGSEGA